MIDRFAAEKSLGDARDPNYAHATVSAAQSDIHPGILTAAQLCEQAARVRQLVARVHDRVLGAVPQPANQASGGQKVGGTGLLDALQQSTTDAFNQLDAAQVELERLLRALAA